MIPTPSDPRWKDLVQNPAKYTYKFLALQILMQRMARKGVDDVQAAVDEVYGFFQQNEKLIHDDIVAIFG